MFRLRLFLAAALATAVGLLAPAKVEAGFSLTILQGATINPVTGEVTGGTILASSSGTSGIGFSSTSASFNTGSLSGAALGQTNSPGNPYEAFLLDTSIEVANTGTATTLTFLLSDDGFTLPGASGDELFYNTRLNSLPSGDAGNGIVFAFNGPNDPNLDVYTRIVSPATSVDERTQAQAFVFSPLAGFGPFVSPTESFVRGPSYTIQSVIHMTLGNYEKAQITTRSTVAAPAPGALVLLGTAVPFFGLLRRRLRRTAETPVAA